MSGPCLSQSYNFRSNLWTVAIEGRQYCGLLYWSYTHYYDKLIDGEKKTHTHTEKITQAQNVYGKGKKKKVFTQTLTSINLRIRMKPLMLRAKITLKSLIDCFSPYISDKGLPFST